MSDKTEKIAIIYYDEQYGEYDETYTQHHITEWVDLSKAELKVLLDNIHDIPAKDKPNKLWRVAIIKQCSVEETLKTVEECLALATEAKKKKALAAEKRKVAARKRAKDKKAKSEEDERILLAELSKKYSVDNND